MPRFPNNLQAVPPQGGTAIFYRGISTGSIDTTHTVSGLVKGTTCLFKVRAVNRAAKSSPSNRVEATPTAPEPQVFSLDFTHFANSGGADRSGSARVVAEGAPLGGVLRYSNREVGVIGMGPSQRCGTRCSRRGARQEGSGRRRRCATWERQRSN